MGFDQKRAPSNRLGMEWMPNTFHKIQVFPKEKVRDCRAIENLWLHRPTDSAIVECRPNVFEPIALLLLLNDALGRIIFPKRSQNMRSPHFWCLRLVVNCLFPESECCCGGTFSLD